jgi:hypothetical protein
VASRDEAVSLIWVAAHYLEKHYYTALQYIGVGRTVLLKWILMEYLGIALTELLMVETSAGPAVYFTFCKRTLLSGER